VSTDESTTEVAVLQQILQALTPLTQEVRQRILDTVSTFFAIPGAAPRAVGNSSLQPISPLPSSWGFRDTQFSDRPTLTPKQFLLEKEPRTDVERVACLAFYLTHYRDTPHFKTIDISKLNTEAAQAKFSNAAYSVDNATKLGYLVPATRGNKQLSAIGEQFVQTLPDREKAKALLSRRPRVGQRAASRKREERAS
jgi:hypothetical protein